MPSKKIPQPMAEASLEPVMSRQKAIKKIQADSSDAPLKEKKPRKPLTEDQRAVRVANLAKAREVRAKLKSEAK